MISNSIELLRHDSLREYRGKQLVSFLRKGDFAHAGEEEAIDLAFSHVAHAPEQTILDVGCGLGGTAAYIQNHRLGQVTGLDIEKEAIAYAEEKYPEIPFYCCDVLDATDVMTQPFDMICLFNAFYAFPEPFLALETLNKLAKTNGTLILFDYSDLCIQRKSPLFRTGDKDTSPFRPIPLQNIDILLEQSGWQLLKKIDLTLQYTQWYIQLMNRLKNNKDETIHLFGESLFQKALTTYSSIQESLVKGVLGGILVCAQKV